MIYPAQKRICADLSPQHFADLSPHRSNLKSKINWLEMGLDLTYSCMILGKW